MKIMLANPRGFCAGVDRAIEIVERAVELFGAPIHVRHEVVHNKHVVDRLRGMGAVFVGFGAKPKVRSLTPATVLMSKTPGTDMMTDSSWAPTTGVPGAS